MVVSMLQDIWQTNREFTCLAGLSLFALRRLSVKQKNNNLSALCDSVVKQFYL